MFLELTLSALAGGIIAGVDMAIEKNKKKNEPVDETKTKILEIKRLWESSIKESGNKNAINASGKTFELINVRKKTFGYKAETKLPLGVSYETLGKMIPTLEGNFNATITVDKDKYNDRIDVEIIQERPEFKYRPIKTEDDKPFLAYEVNGKPYIVDLNYEPHIVWCGKSRSGKSTAMYITLTNHLVNCKDIELYVAQVVNGESDIFADCKQVKMIAKNYNETEVILNKLISIAEKRAKIISENKSMNIKHYNKKNPKNKLKRIILVMEEFSFFVVSQSDSDELKAQKQRCEEVFLRIAKAGAYCGIHLFGVVQRMTHTSINPTIRGQVNVLTFAQKDDNDSKYAINKRDAADLGWRECIYDSSGDYKFLIAPTVDEELQDLKKVLPELRVESSSEVGVTVDSSIKDNSRLTYEETQILKKRAKTEYMEVENESKEDTQPTGSASGLQGKYDKEIIKFIENYGAITIKQCDDMFYKSYERSRDRLKKLSDKGVIKSYKVDGTRNIAYCTDKELSYHDLLIRSFYVELIKVGAEVLEFKTTPRYLNDMIRPDAYIRYKYNNKEYRTMLEVDYKHPSSYDKAILYEKLFDEIGFKFNVVIMMEGIAPRIRSKKVEFVKTSFELNDILSNILIK